MKALYAEGPNVYTKDSDDLVAVFFFTDTTANTTKQEQQAAEYAALFARLVSSNAEHRLRQLEIALAQATVKLESAGRPRAAQTARVSLLTHAPEPAIQAP